MRIAMTVIAVLLAGCSAGQQQTLSAICAADPALYAAGQAAGTVVTVTVPGTAGIGAAALTADQVLLHPAVVGACAGIGKLPVAAAASTPKP